MPTAIWRMSTQAISFSPCRDDVPEDVKKRRLSEVIETFHEVAGAEAGREVQSVHAVLITEVRGAGTVPLFGHSLCRPQNGTRTNGLVEQTPTNGCSSPRCRFTPV